MQQLQFQVVEGGSNKARALRGYGGNARAAFCNGSGIKFVSIDNREKEAPAFFRHNAIQKLKNCLLENKQIIKLDYRQDTLPGGMRVIPDSSVNHLHMHMFSGELGEMGTKHLLQETSRVIVENGVFFLSLDELFFSLDVLDRHEGNVLADLDRMLQERFTLVFRSFIRARPEDPSGRGSVVLLSKEQKLLPILTPEAVSLSTSFGVPLSTSKPWVFFRRFSDCAERFGQYFAILKKE